MDERSTLTSKMSPGEPGLLRAEGENKRGIGAIAGAMAEEILNLHIYLDGQKNRPELLTKFQQEQRKNG